MRCRVVPIRSSTPLPPAGAAAGVLIGCAGRAGAIGAEGATLGGTEATCAGIGTPPRPRPTKASTHLHTDSIDRAVFATSSGEKAAPQVSTNSRVLFTASAVG
jgi:hypothetical protein